MLKLQHDMAAGLVRRWLGVALSAGVSLLLVACTSTVPAPESAPQPQAAPSAGLELLEKAEAAYRDGNWNDAKTQYEFLLKSHPRNEYLWFKLGNTCTKLGLYDNAAYAYQAALSLEPTYSRASYNLGLIRLIQSEAAMEHARKTAPAEDRAIAQVDQVRLLTRRLINLMNTSSESRTTPKEANVLDSPGAPKPVPADK